MARKRLDLTFPPRQSLKPVIYHLVKDYDLVPNILRAQIHPAQEGRMVLEVTGSKENWYPLARALGDRRLESDILPLDETLARILAAGLVLR